MLEGKISVFSADLRRLEKENIELKQKYQKQKEKVKELLAFQDNFSATLKEFNEQNFANVNQISNFYRKSENVQLILEELIKKKINRYQASEKNKVMKQLKINSIFSQGLAKVLLVVKDSIEEDFSRRQHEFNDNESLIISKVLEQNGQFLPNGILSGVSHLNENQLQHQDLLRIQDSLQGLRDHLRSYSYEFYQKEVCELQTQLEELQNERNDLKDDLLMKDINLKDLTDEVESHQNQLMTNLRLIHKLCENYSVQDISRFQEYQMKKNANNFDLEEYQECFDDSLSELENIILKREQAEQSEQRAQKNVLENLREEKRALEEKLREERQERGKVQQELYKCLQKLKFEASKQA